MASRLNQAFIEEIKARIEKSRQAIKVEETIEATQTAIKRLQDHVNGTVRMDKTDIAAAMALFAGAKLLLAKTMPDLKLMELELSGPGGGPVQVQEILIRSVDAASDRPSSEG
jgi:hypothetical protein